MLHESLRFPIIQIQHDGVTTFYTYPDTTPIGATGYLKWEVRGISCKS